MAPDAEQLHSESFVMNGFSFAALDKEYANETRPNAGVDASPDHPRASHADGGRDSLPR